LRLPEVYQDMLKAFGKYILQSVMGSNCLIIRWLLRWGSYSFWVIIRSDPWGSWARWARWAGDPPVATC